jgi:hypothetical protein
MTRFSEPTIVGVCPKHFGTAALAGAAVRSQIVATASPIAAIEFLA